MGLKIRASVSQNEMPTLAEAIIGHYIKECKDRGFKFTTFEVAKLPGSVNHMKPFKSHRLAPWVGEFRQEVKNAMPLDWKPTKLTTAVILFYSKLWLTAEAKVRKMDCDNRVKPIFDAIQLACDHPDENNWAFHVFKAPAKRDRLRVWLFEMGDVVEFFK